MRSTPAEHGACYVAAWSTVSIAAASSDSSSQGIPHWSTRLHRRRLPRPWSRGGFTVLCCVEFSLLAWCPASVITKLCPFSHNERGRNSASGPGAWHAQLVALGVWRLQAAVRDHRHGPDHLISGIVYESGEWTALVWSRAGSWFADGCLHGLGLCGPRQQGQGHLAIHTC